MAHEKYFDQLSCALSTKKLVKICNTPDQLFIRCQKQNVFNQQIITFFNSYFTWYPKQSPSLNDTGCYLVGFNLRQACFNLQDTCVLMKECSVFNTSCTTCQVGKFMNDVTQILTISDPLFPMSHSMVKMTTPFENCVCVYPDGILAAFGEPG